MFIAMAVHADLLLSEIIHSLSIHSSSPPYIPNPLVRSLSLSLSLSLPLHPSSPHNPFCPLFASSPFSSLRPFPTPLTTLPPSLLLCPRSGRCAAGSRHRRVPFEAILHSILVVVSAHLGNNRRVHHPAPCAAKRQTSRVNSSGFAFLARLCRQGQEIEEEKVRLAMILLMAGAWMSNRQCVSSRSPQEFTPMRCQRWIACSML